METSDPQKQFQAAVKVIQSLPPKGSYHPSYETMLRFYGFYKQATLGPCNIMKPGIWDLVGRYKWNAWNKLGGMSKEDAMKAYVEDMKRVAQEVIDMLPKIENADEMFQYFESLYDVIPDMPRPPASYFKDKAVRLKRTVLSNPNIKVNGSVDKGMNEELSVQQKTNGAKEGLVEESVVTSHSESELYTDSMDQVDQVDQEKASSVLTAITFKTYHTSSVVQHTKMPQENSRKAAEEAKAAGPVKDTIPFEGEAGMSGRQSTETGAKGLDNELYQGRDKKAKSSSVGAGHKEAHAGKCMCNLQEEIVAAVYSLQADMQNVMLRLTRLEEIVMSQMSLQNSSKRWLPGGQVRIYLFLVFWPFVIHWLHSACRKGVKN